MFFTREDYEKIYSYIIQNSVKDSDLDIAESLNKIDYITIVQDGVNKKMKCSDFISELQTLSSPDVINITAQKKVTQRLNLVDAIKEVPYLCRKSGLIITFLDVNNDWVMYQFIGVLNQWNEESLWKLK